MKIKEITRIAGVRVSAQQTGEPAPVFIYTQSPKGWVLYDTVGISTDESEARDMALRYHKALVEEHPLLSKVQYGFHGTITASRCERVFQADFDRPVLRANQK